MRQAFVIYTGSPENVLPIWEPYYDVVERVVHFEPPRGQLLVPDALYTIELRVPSVDSGFGFRSFDGMSLDPGDVPLKFHFRTRRSTRASRSRVEREPVACERALEIFREAGCATLSCHGGDAPSMGLNLDSARGLLETAISEVAHQTERGAESGVVLRDPQRFGIQMPVLDPGNPGNSYLLYKLLRNPASYSVDPGTAGFCETLYDVPLTAECLEPPSDELVRLREWFVLGAPMPREGVGGRPVSRDELRELARFVAAGADCR